MQDLACLLLFVICYIVISGITALIGLLAAIIKDADFFLTSWLSACLLCTISVFVLVLMMG